MLLKNKFKVALLAGLTLATISASASNLVTNGNFSSSFSGWNLDVTNGGSTNIDAVLGAGFSNVSGNYNYLYQFVPTVAGQTYTFSFDVTLAATGPGSVESYFGGLSGSPVLVLNNTGLNAGTASYSFTTVASSSSSIVLFGVEDESAFNYINNVSVTPGVPEPATNVLMFLGVAGVLAFASSRRLA